MGLATRIIATLLIKDGMLVKGKQFSADRVIGHPLQAIETFQARGVDELCILDVSATPAERGPDFKMIEQLTARCFSPVTIGGGVRSVQDVRDLLNAGADKICIRTLIPLIPEAAAIVGKQAVCAAIDYKLASRGFNQALTACSIGAGEILLTSVDREGMMTGYDLELIRRVSAAVDIPVIAHGGCSGYADMCAAIHAGASAVAAGALWAFTDATPRGAAQFLREQGLEARCT